MFFSFIHSILQLRSSDNDFQWPHLDAFKSIAGASTKNNRGVINKHTPLRTISPICIPGLQTGGVVIQKKKRVLLIELGVCACVSAVCVLTILWRGCAEACVCQKNTYRTLCVSPPPKNEGLSFSLSSLCIYAYIYMRTHTRHDASLSLGSFPDSHRQNSSCRRVRVCISIEWTQCFVDPHSYPGG